MDEKKIIACVTGASGMVGRRIVERLLCNGHRVRVLTRKDFYEDPRVDLFCGGLEEEETLSSFIHHADILFHCAAELKDEAKMWRVNVEGTERLIRFAENENIQYLCYLSSAGVVGRTNNKWVDENTDCKPQNVYEKSKWEAEKIVSKGIDGCNVLILRPTNVIDDKRPGAIASVRDGTILGRLKLFLKGGECAHIVHAEDVADAAIFFVLKRYDRPQIFFVSCDHEPMNTYAGIWAIYKAIEKKQQTEDVRSVSHVPLIIPHVMRRLWRGTGNKGDVRYSSKRLMDTGFRFSLGLEGALRRTISK